MEEIIVVVEYRARTGEEAHAVQRFIQVAAELRTHEPQCRNIRVLQRQDDPSRVTLTQEWPDRDTFERCYRQLPQVRDALAAAEACTEGPPQISFWNSSPAWERIVSMRPRG